MLSLKNITKVYRTGDFAQKALNNVSLDFGEQEFASILGPSGSGKTTLLNIIGGLDRYTSGDLVIDGVSTKRFEDANWDAYRNHRIGFVFQSYNLISHQTVLNNVRLALTLSGISKREGTKRAKAALEQVGLKEHIHKRPAQLSGGQMQRVAIARALVNDPDILLADEPTGALDSETSVQIMELLKTIAKTKLVIMVTHNPDLAERYSTRIIELKDGKIIKDHHLSKSRAKAKSKAAPIKDCSSANQRKSKKTKMSFLTALGLSFNNLLTKKKRTILIAFAGSIGIIGIALILAVSTGFQNYVDSIQEDTLDSYPLMLTEESFSLAGLMTTDADVANSDTAKTREQAKKDIAEYPVMTNMLKSVATNDLKSFKAYYDAHAAELKNDMKTVTVGYDVKPWVYTVDATNTLAKLNPSDTFDSMFGSGMEMMTNFTGGSTSLYSPFYNSDYEALKSKYDLLAGRLPEKYDEVIVNLASEGVISDLLAYELGLKDTSELDKLVKSLMSGESVDVADKPALLDYADLMSLDLRVIVPSDLYRYNEKYDVYEEMSDDKDYLKDVYDNKSIRLKVVGVITAKKGATTQTLEQGVLYRTDLVDEIISHAEKSEVVQKQLKTKDVDVFSGKRFDEEKNSFDYGFADLVKVDEEKLAAAFGGSVDPAALQEATMNAISEINAAIDIDTAPAEAAFSDAFDSLVTALSTELDDYKTDHLVPLPAADAEDFLQTFVMAEGAQTIFSDLETDYVVPTEVFRETFYATLKSLLDAYLGSPAASFLSFSDFTAAAKSAEPFTTLYETLVSEMGKAMTEAKIKAKVLTEVGDLATTLSNSFANAFNVDADAITSAFTLNFTEDELTRVMQSLLSGNSTSDQKSNLKKLGYQDKTEPSYLYFYFTSFDGKENFIKFLDAYNDSVEKEKKINYSDMVGILMDSVKIIVNAVSYVLIAFVSISLVVSSIMIGIITYISVYERTKEIGILRAMGASKRNISSIFNAETFIIGLLSGLFGIGISYLLLIPINAILKALTDLENLRAVIPVMSALRLVILSVVLTIIGGLIPAKAASKKDPVEALRTE